VGSDTATLVGVTIGGAVVLALVVLRSAFLVVPEYQRAVLLRFGRVLGQPRGPGLVVRIPIADRVVKVNLRVEVVDIPSQAVITQDNVTAQVDAVAYFQVVEPIRAVIGVDDFRFASQRIAMTSLRSIIGRYELDSLLAHRRTSTASYGPPSLAARRSGVSRFDGSRSGISISRPNCCGPWRAKPRRSGSGGPR
jgi:regulator of protease activity HflC (stomatin/prohibitin superfamily)